MVAKLHENVRVKVVSLLSSKGEDALKSFLRDA